MSLDNETCFAFDFAPSPNKIPAHSTRQGFISVSEQCYVVFWSKPLERETARRSHYRLWKSLKLSCTVQVHCFKAGCFHFKKTPVFVSELRVGVRKMLLQLICLHGSIREGFKTNDTLGQLLITSLYESESIVEKNIVTFSLSFTHSFLCSWKFKAVAIDTPVDLEIWKLIHTPPVA